MSTTTLPYVPSNLHTIIKGLKGKKNLSITRTNHSRSFPKWPRFPSAKFSNASKLNEVEELEIFLPNKPSFWQRFETESYEIDVTKS